MRFIRAEGWQNNVSILKHFIPLIHTNNIKTIRKIQFFTLLHLPTNEDKKRVRIQRGTRVCYIFLESLVSNSFILSCTVNPSFKLWKRERERWEIRSFSYLGINKQSFIRLQDAHIRELMLNFNHVIFNRS